MKIDQNIRRDKIFALLDEVESELEDDIDELMNDSDTEFVFEKEDSMKYDVSDDQPKNILIPGANIHIIEGQGRNPDGSEEKSQEGRADIPKAKEKPKGQSKKRRKKKEKRRLRNLKFP